MNGREAADAAIPFVPLNSVCSTANRRFVAAFLSILAHRSRLQWLCFIAGTLRSIAVKIPCENKYFGNRRISKNDMKNKLGFLNSPCRAALAETNVALLLNVAAIFRDLPSRHGV